MIEEILKDLFEETTSKTKTNEIIEGLDKLLSGERYETFLKTELSESAVKRIFLPEFGYLVRTLMLPDEILVEIPQELRERMSTYLDNLLEKITKIITDEKSRILNAQKKEKTLDEMSNDELIDYLFSKLGK